MALMVGLGILVLIGTVIALLWGGTEVVPPWHAEPGREPLPPRQTLRRYLWYLAVGLGAGIVSGIVMMGAGGRLAMRLLAVTAGDSAQGRVTEAEEIVGVITTDGTLGLVLFIGILGGMVTGLLYMLLYRLLPGGRWRGPAFGALLLVAAATRLDPLRAENPDFDIVGPGSVAVLMFIALGIGHGMLLDALAGRYGRSLPLLSARPRSIASHAPLLILIPGVVVMVPVTVGGLVAIVTQAYLSRRDLVSRIYMWGRALIVLAVLVALPGFLADVIDIAGRS